MQFARARFAPCFEILCHWLAVMSRLQQHGQSTVVLRRVWKTCDSLHPRRTYWFREAVRRSRRRHRATCRRQLRHVRAADAQLRRHLRHPALRDHVTDNEASHWLATYSRFRSVYIKGASGHFPWTYYPDIYPRTSSWTIPPPFYMVYGISSFHHHHPPIYSVKRSTISVYKIDSGSQVFVFIQTGLLHLIILLLFLQSCNAIIHSTAFYLVPTLGRINLGFYLTSTFVY